jgi:hypothetical protein
VHLVDNEQMPEQRRRAQVRVPNLQVRQQRLIDGADGDLRGEEALRVLPGPAFVRLRLVRIVGPQHLEPGEDLLRLGPIWT